MALTNKNDEAVEAAFKHGWARRVQRKRPGEGIGGGPETIRSVYRHALPVYTCSLEDVTQGRTESSAKHAGWRYLLLSGDHSVVETADVAADGEPTFRGLTSGGKVIPRLDSALHSVEPFARDSARYELRILQIPALYTVAFWLKDAANRADRFVFIVSPNGDEAPRVVSPHDFWSTIRGSAAQRFPLSAELED